MPTSDVAIAIVGAGASGAFFADAIRNATGPHATIDVYESTGRVGGRALDGDGVELGASMIIQQNRYFAEAATSLGLTLVTPQEEWLSGHRRSLLAIVGKGRRFEFEESPTHDLLTLWRLQRAYGLGSLSSLRRRGGEFIRNFSRLYDAQAAGHAFASPRAMLAAASMDAWPRMSCRDALDDLLLPVRRPAATLSRSSSSSRIAPEATVGEQRGSTGRAPPRSPPPHPPRPPPKPPRIASGLVAALMRNNYGQDWAESGALCCFTAIAPLAAGGSRAARRVREGNAAVMRGLFQRSRAHLFLNTSVTAVRLFHEAGPSGGDRRLHARPRAYELVLTLPSGGSARRRYDVVALAVPDARSRIDLLGLLDVDEARLLESGTAGRLRTDDELDERRKIAGDGVSERRWREAAGHAVLPSLLPPMDFVTVHTTLVTGLLDPAFFGKSAAQLGAVNALGDIFVADDSIVALGNGGSSAGGGSGVPFSSIGRVGVVPLDGQLAADLEQACDAEPTSALRWRNLASLTSTSGLPRWKLFSPSPLDASQLAALFAWHDAASVRRHSWSDPGAYPRSRPLSDSELEAPFILHEARRACRVGGARGPHAVRVAGLVVNAAALETTTSAMEVMAVSARNAALLVAQQAEAVARADALQDCL